MKKIYFKCELKTDIVLNASLATEGNMQTLDYISGSNFLGIVAGQLYAKESPDLCYQLFHSGEVSFGDALIATDNAQSYAMPFSLFVNKLKKSVVEDSVWIHHYLNDNNLVNVFSYYLVHNIHHVVIILLLDHLLVNILLNLKIHLHYYHNHFYINLCLY